VKAHAWAYRDRIVVVNVELQQNNVSTKFQLRLCMHNIPQSMGPAEQDIHFCKALMILVCVCGTPNAWKQGAFMILLGDT
jgi:hypothetical protein